MKLGELWKDYNGDVWLVCTPELFFGWRVMPYPFMPSDYTRNVSKIDTENWKKIGQIVLDSEK